jgi:hypothetical protein
MAAFSATEAALEGFRITRENPGAFVRWVAVSFAVSLLGAVVTVSMPAEVRAALETLRSDETPDPGTLAGALFALAPILVFGLAFQCMMAAAVYRVIFRHEDTRFGYLRLGIDELRLMGLTLVYVGMAIGLLFLLTLGSALLAAAASLAGQAPALFVGACAELFSLGFIVYVAVRLSLAPVATFAERRLTVMESWTLTRGQFWRLFLTYALALCCVVVIGFLALILFAALAGIVVLLTGGQLSDVGAIFKPDETSIAAYLNPGAVAYMVVGSIFSTLYYAVIAAPGAVAYRHLHPRELGVSFA